MHFSSLFALPLVLTAVDVAKASPVEQLQVQNFYYKVVPTGVYVNYVTFSASVSDINTQCTRDGSLLEDVWYSCDDSRLQFRLDKSVGFLYIKGRVDGWCLSGDSSFSPSGDGDGWSVPSIWIQLSDQEDYC